MNRAEFIEKLIELYPLSFKNDNAQAWIDNYCEILWEDIDYDALLVDTLSDYESIVYAPSPAYLTKLIKRKYGSMLF